MGVDDAMIAVSAYLVSGEKRGHVVKSGPVANNDQVRVGRSPWRVSAAPSKFHYDRLLTNWS